MMRGVLRRRGGRAWVWLLVGLLAGGAAGAGTVWLLKRDRAGIPGGPRLGKAEELALIPADSVGFVHVRVRDVWKSEYLTEFRKIVEKAGPEALAMLDEGFVPAPSTLDRVTLVIMQGPSATKQTPAGPVGPGGPPRPKFPPKNPVPEPPARPKPLIEMPEDVEPVGMFAFTAPYDAGKVRSAMLPGATIRQAAGKEYWEDKGKGLAAYFPSDTMLVIGSPAGVTQFVSKQSGDGKQPEGPLSGAIALAGDGSRHFVGAVNAHYFHVNLDRMKAEFHDAPVNVGELLQLARDAEPLLRAESFAVSLGMGSDESQVDVRAYFKDDSGAQEGEKAVRALAEFAHKKLAEPRKELEKTLKGSPDKAKPRPLADLPQAVMALVGIGAINKAEEYLANPPLKRDGKEVVVTFDLPSMGGVFVGSVAVTAGMLIPATMKVRDAAGRMQSSNNLKQIGLGMHNYANVNDRLPSVIGVNGPNPGLNPKPLLSWRVHLLPYVEQNALYNEFHLDEPWDSPHNKPLIDRMPAVYASPLAAAPPGQTYYKVLVGGGALFSIPHNKYNLGNVPDGTSNTIMVVEGGQPVIWTQPDDVPFDPRKPIPDLSLQGKRQINVLMGDGSVRTIDLDHVSETTLKNAIMADDGMVLGPDW